MEISKIVVLIKNLKFLLITLTLIQIAYFTIIIVDGKAWSTLDEVYRANYWVIGFNILVQLIFLWFNYKKMPVKNSTKTNNMLMIICLSTIGMWLFLPNKNDIKKLLN